MSISRWSIQQILQIRKLLQLTNRVIFKIWKPKAEEQNSSIKHNPLTDTFNDFSMPIKKSKIFWIISFIKNKTNSYSFSEDAKENRKETIYTHHWQYMCSVLSQLVWIMNHFCTRIIIISKHSALLCKQTLQVFTRLFSSRAKRIFEKEEK